MNNERLKFRVWDKVNKFFIQFRPFNDKEPFTYILGDAVGSNHIEKGMGIIEQCLGLKDRNEKLIFEGDILRKVEHTFLELSNTSDAYLLDKITIDKSLIKKGEEEKDYSGDSYVEVWYYGKTDVATMDRFPHYWLKDEYFGYEGEELERSDDWEIVGNIHENFNLIKTGNKRYEKIIDS